VLEEAEVIAGCVVETVNRHRASTYRQLAVLDDPLNSGIAGAERVLTEAGAASRRPPRLCSNAPALLFSSEAKYLQVRILKAACALLSRLVAAPSRVIALWSSERVG